MTSSITWTSLPFTIITIGRPHGKVNCRYISSQKRHNVCNVQNVREAHHRGNVWRSDLLGH